MSQPAKLRVMVNGHVIRKLDLPHGISELVESLKSLKSIIERQYGFRSNESIALALMEILE